MKYLFLVLLFFISIDFLGCSCTPIEFKEAYRKSKIVVVAKVIDEEKFSEDYFHEINKETGEGEIWLGMNGYLVEVTETLKGKIKSVRFWILSSRESCGPSLNIGSTYLMYLKKSRRLESVSSSNNSALLTGYCFGTKNLELSKAKLELDYLRK